MLSRLRFQHYGDAEPVKSSVEQFGHENQWFEPQITKYEVHCLCKMSQILLLNNFESKFQSQLEGRI